MSDTLVLHFALNDDRDNEATPEDIAASLLGAAGYAAQSLHFGTNPAVVERYLRSEANRIKGKMAAGKMAAGTV